LRDYCRLGATSRRALAPFHGLLTVCSNRKIPNRSRSPIGKKLAGLKEQL
jgi:hypothetical protein